MKFVKYLKEQIPGKRLAIFWDGASYHNSQDFRELLLLYSFFGSRFLTVIDSIKPTFRTS